MKKVLSWLWYCFKETIALLLLCAIGAFFSLPALYFWIDKKLDTRTEKEKWEDDKAAWSLI